MSPNEKKYDSKQDVQHIAQMLKKTTAPDHLSQLLEQASTALDTSRKTLKIAVLLSYAVAILATTNIYGIYKGANPVREYFGIDANGRIIPLVPLKDAYRKDSDVVNFTRDRITKAFTLSFSNYRSEMEDSRSNFTDKGFQNFLAEMDNAGFLNLIKKKLMNLNGTSGTGVIVRKEIVNGVFTWKLEVPLNIKFSGQTTSLPPQDFIAIVTISRIPTSQSSEGIAISQIVTRPVR